MTAFRSCSDPPEAVPQPPPTRGFILVYTKPVTFERLVEALEKQRNEQGDSQ